MSTLIVVILLIANLIILRIFRVRIDAAREVDGTRSDLKIIQNLLLHGNWERASMFGITLVLPDFRVYVMRLISKREEEGLDGLMSEQKGELRSLVNTFRATNWVFFAATVCYLVCFGATLNLLHPIGELGIVLLILSSASVLLSVVLGMIIWRISAKVLENMVEATIMFSGIITDRVKMDREFAAKRQHA